MEDDASRTACIFMVHGKQIQEGCLATKSALKKIKGGKAWKDRLEAA